MAGKRCFVVMGYGVRNDLSSGKQINLDRVYHEIIKPVVVDCGYECIRGDEVLDSGLIDESMYYGILESDLVIADISTLNPNAIYELGVRHGVRRFRTIIMMETGDKFFFDLNHNRTLTYTYHRKIESFNKESVAVRERLENIIKAIEQEEQVDSPLYHFVNDLQEPKRTAEGSVKGKAKKPIYERIKEATELRRKEKYKEAFCLFENLSKEIPSDPFFIQQMALCTYKAEDPVTIEALEKAYSFLSPISDTVDPETNGLIGSIYKRRFLLTGASADIDMAINAYKKAYNLFNDYYTGENYAFCLLLKTTKVAEPEEKEELKIMSKHTYREIFDMYGNIVEDEINTDYEIWMIGTLSACALVLQKSEAHRKLDELFLSKADKMKKTSYLQQKEQLLELLRK